ncbi:nuclear transport factor 2 family protein [Nonomuraea sp. NPDC047897]|uniref:nuclear transport factor 2 family protein n=1 Tax=Nonomuraea sp. NPDC047897 TaxID=3364346 RepID=UPI00371CC533
MRTRTIAGAAAAVIIGGVVAVASSDFLRAVATDAVQPLPSPTTSRGPLDPAAQRYLDAVTAKDTDALAAAFAPQALVVDVGREIRGRNAIRQWAANEVIGGRYTLLEHTPRAGGVTMLVRFQPGGVGGFRAHYHFDISDGLITKATLEYA